jgi:hypothetical protein
MAVLHVHLQDGFSGEPVTIRLDGRTVVEKSSVKTRPQLGLAEIIELSPPHGRLTLEVQVPAQVLRETITLDPDRDLYLGLSLRADGTLSHQVSESPFGYV